MINHLGSNHEDVDGEDDNNGNMSTSGKGGIIEMYLTLWVGVGGRFKGRNGGGGMNIEWWC